MANLLGILPESTQLSKLILLNIHELIFSILSSYFLIPILFRVLNLYLGLFWARIYLIYRLLDPLKNIINLLVYIPALILQSDSDVINYSGVFALFLVLPFALNLVIALIPIIEEKINTDGTNSY